MMPSADFERAFVAISYVLGRRGVDLTAPLSPSFAEARGLAQALAAEARGDRARALALALSRVVAALEARRLR
jgi:hypothetical protein